MLAAQAYAWLCGAERVEPEHLEVLQHVLWDSPEEQPLKCAQVIARIANPPGMRIAGLLMEAEEVLAQAMATTPDAERYPLERTTTRLYRFEGRFDEVRDLLRASWGRSPEPAAVLKELWLLDYASMPIEAWLVALD